MHIATFTAYSIRVPLRRTVKHASATREPSDNLLIRCELGDGTEGWGEGVPREYVTGETIEGAFQQLDTIAWESQFGGEYTCWDNVVEVCDQIRLPTLENDPRSCYGNALRCALELSILDAFGHLFAQPVAVVTERFAPAEAIRTKLDQVRYSGAITAEGPRSELVSALKMRLYGFRHCKIKVAVADVDDRLRLQRIRRVIGRRMDVRLDANEAWQADTLVAKLEPLLAFNISCVEQPVAHREVEMLADVRRKLAVPFMLDESLTSVIDGREAIRLGTCDLFNIRISKCGGFLNSLRLAGMAAEAGLGYQLGCHPGETGILSAAGRQWATSVRDIAYLEGSYDRHLLRELLTHEDITFGYGGLAGALDAPGLGITINHGVLQRLIKTKKTYQVG